MKATARRLVIEIVGWTLLVAGIAGLFLPGPGLLLIAASLVVLSRQYSWAQRLLVPVRRRAYAAAAESVQSWPRILMSSTMALGLLGFGVLWIVHPPAPSWWPLDEQWWLFGGLATGAALIVSGIAAISLMVYSYRNFRHAQAALRGAGTPVDN